MGVLIRNVTYPDKADASEMALRNVGRNQT